MLLTTAPTRQEYKRVVERLRALRVPFDEISPDPGFARVGVPALVVDDDARQALHPAAGDLTLAGWVQYRSPATVVPVFSPPVFAPDLVGQVRIFVLASCVADEAKIRLIAQVSGDLEPAFPYLNAEIATATYNAGARTFTFMDGHRLISLHPQRVAVAKADDIVAGWRTLEVLRCLVNRTWARPREIEPSWELRRRPPTLEIFKRLPGTDCGLCGERTCLAFADRLRRGEGKPEECPAVFGGTHSHLQEALLQVCAGLGSSPNTARNEPIEEGGHG